MRKFWLALLLTLVCVSTLSACEKGNQQQKSEKDAHIHAFEEWLTTTPPSCTEDGIDTRYCSCGEMQTKKISSNGHTEVIDAAINATCDTEGKTEGKHCGVCNATLIEQTTIHPVGHQYNSGEITTKATCLQNGIETFTCKICGFLYEKTYSLPQYSATELYNQSVKYVGEIVTYDKKGAEIALGTGFVISSDGKILTNYHVIEGAYSADITINDIKYTISSVLAYDANIDLAVLKISASGLSAATICKQPVSVGTTVYAIGSSRGMTNTYSQGIVTYADRIVDGVSHIQHDASITHGNSGGPLINIYGEVIGINTWEISDSQNLNFAVFVDELDNLVYGTPRTLPELYQEEAASISANNLQQVLIEFLVKYGVAGALASENETLVQYSIEMKDASGATYSLVYTLNTGWMYIEKAYSTQYYDIQTLLYFSGAGTNEVAAKAIAHFWDTNRKVKSGFAFVYREDVTNAEGFDFFSWFGDGNISQQAAELICQRNVLDLIAMADYMFDYYNLPITMEDFGYAY